METRTKSIVGMTIGYIVGDGVSMLFGFSVLDISSILISAIFALIGVYVTFKYF